MLDMHLNRGVNTKNDEMWDDMNRVSMAMSKLPAEKCARVQKRWKNDEKNPGMATERGWKILVNSNFANAELSAKFVPYNAFHSREWIKQVFYNLLLRFMCFMVAVGVVGT